MKDQCKFKYHTLFSASFYKIDEGNQKSDESEKFILLNINQNSTESDIDKTDAKSQLEHQIQFEEAEEFAWIFDKI